jgi:hypothetical protein
MYVCTYAFTYVYDLMMYDASNVVADAAAYDAAAAVQEHNRTHICVHRYGQTDTNTDKRIQST